MVVLQSHRTEKLLITLEMTADFWLAVQKRVSESLIVVRKVGSSNKS